MILTAGGTPTKLEVPGELEYAGRGVSYCAVCDGAFFKGEIIAVIGGGDAAVEEADYLTRYAEKVYVIHRRDEFRASKILQERLFANPKIEVIWNKRVREFMGGPAGLQSIELEDTVTGEQSSLAATGVLRLHRLPAQHRAGEAALRARRRRATSITDDRMMTSIPGLFAAGDVGRSSPARSPPPWATRRPRPSRSRSISQTAQSRLVEGEGRCLSWKS